MVVVEVGFDIAGIFMISLLDEFLELLDILFAPLDVVIILDFNELMHGLD